VTTLSTHVLDTELGTPAAGVGVELYHADLQLAEAKTNADGRIASLGTELPGPDTYRLVFDLAQYFRARGRASPFLERLSIEFRVGASDRHLHIPLLLSPYACTTYRGS
jgi:5-hydroxyisourate hydrolase